MPINNQQHQTQIPVSGDDDSKLSRAGGASSKGSTSIAGDTGSSLAGMQSALLRGLDPDVKALSGNRKPSRQFETKAAGGAGAVAGAAKLPKAFAYKRTSPDGKAGVVTGGVNPKGLFSARESTAPKGSVKKVR